eukprot:scaffold2529_cov122-Isochrysis_galbana.AAC.11
MRATGPCRADQLVRLDQIVHRQRLWRHALPPQHWRSRSRTARHLPTRRPPACRHRQPSGPRRARALPAGPRSCPAPLPARAPAETYPAGASVRASPAAAAAAPQRKTDAPLPPILSPAGAQGQARGPEREPPRRSGTLARASFPPWCEALRALAEAPPHQTAQPPRASPMNQAHPPTPPPAVAGQCAQWRRQTRRRPRQHASEASGPSPRPAIGRRGARTRAAHCTHQPPRSGPGSSCGGGPQSRP